MVDHIRLYVDNQEVPTKFIEFSDGAVNIQLLEELPFPKMNGKYHLHVSAAVPTQAILQELALFKNVVQHNSIDDEYSWSIHFDYHPYARADRRFHENEPFCLSTFIENVVSIFDDVTLLRVVTSMDVHSEVTRLLWEERGVYFAEASQDVCLQTALPQGTTYSVLVSPDKGAVEKARECLQTVKGILLVTASKVRDKETGRIIRTELPYGTKDVIVGHTVLIVDDICDGGGTFLPLADALKAAGAKEVHLYVTHGIFSKGLDVFSGHIDKIFCYQTVGNYVTKEQIWSYNKSVKEIN